MQKIQNLIQSYKPLDFSSIDEKLLEEFPILKEWQKDELFMSFVESTNLSFGIFLQFIEEKEQNKFYQFALSKDCPKIKSDEAFFERTCDIFYKRKKFK